MCIYVLPLPFTNSRAMATYFMYYPSPIITILSVTNLHWRLGGCYNCIKLRLSSFLGPPVEDSPWEWCYNMYGVKLTFQYWTYVGTYPKAGVARLSLGLNAFFSSIGKHENPQMVTFPRPWTEKCVPYRVEPAPVSLLQTFIFLDTGLYIFSGHESAGTFYCVVDASFWYLQRCCRLT
jgi:hypothetical protein